MSDEPSRGAPTKYKPEYCEAIIKYFNRQKTQQQIIGRIKRYAKDGTLIADEEKYKVVPNDLPTFEGFAREIDVSVRSIERWAIALLKPDAIEGEAEYKKLKFPDFCRAYNICKGLQKEFLVDNGLQGNSPPATTIFVLKNVTDMTDKQIIETKDSDLEAKRDAIDEFIDTVRNHATGRTGSPRSD